MIGISSAMPFFFKLAPLNFVNWSVPDSFNPFLKKYVIWPT